MLSKYEFDGTRQAVQDAKEQAESARQERLTEIERQLRTVNYQLAEAKQRVIELPAVIAKYEAEQAQLRALKPADVVRMLLDEQKPEPTP